MCLSSGALETVGKSTAVSLGLPALFLPLSLLTLPGFRAPSQGANDSGPKLLGREELEETAILRLDRGEA